MVQQFGEGTLTLSTRCEQVESPKELASRSREQEEERTRRETMAEITHLENMIKRNPCPQLQAQADKLRSGLNLVPELIGNRENVPWLMRAVLNS